ncbi:Gfo/Idh/MocA family protein [Pseudaestuariivita atlantica]|uniref:Dehydrogenase n=1 Tax=Pseudaestuariivita atlantica TaxID=1317121 RepID=A0A0L1JNG2_9RHOB|nr:Gfo/Idh/MocA family oxidoreductase [Pseudaestuariivita atlantica]KNG93305.1 dehydrogenase [Pseudaestuariivita atlantica]
MTLRVAIAGLGYFSRFHVAAWAGDARVRIVGVCDTDAGRREAAAVETGAQGFAGAGDMVAATAPDIVDIIAPPPAHAELIRASLGRGRPIVCQKPFCTSIEEAQAVIAEAEAAGARIVVHENFRFQPWYRRMKALLDTGDLGAVYQARFALRPGDGRGPDAYLDRQPAFQAMPRLLIHETGVHFIDTFRWMLGDVTRVFADLRRLNPAIAGEDAGLLLMEHAGGARSQFDGNRLVDHDADNLRLTMGEMEIETEGGVLRLNGRGQITLRAFGSTDALPVGENGVSYPTTFGGGCVAFLIGHVIDHLDHGAPLENEAADYIHVMQVAEAAYASAREGRWIDTGGHG